MPANFKLADVLDRGLAAAGAGALLDIGHDDDERDAIARLREMVGRAERTPDLSHLVEAVGRARNPQATATAFIEAKYELLEGAAGVLGPPTSAVSPCPDGVGFHRRFRNGPIYWTPATGAHEVHGPIAAKWASLGAERSVVGYPTGDVEPGDDPDRRGQQCHFQAGMILWRPEIAVVIDARRPLPALRAAREAEARPLDPKHAELLSVSAAAKRGGTPASARGAHEVHGAIAAHYEALGGSASVLGYPVTDELATPDGVGRFNHFEAGSIYWTPATGAHEVHGLIRQFWADHGWERNAALGYPISDELIPDRRIGHRRPERLRKPLLDMPVDLIKLPAEATRVGFSPLASNLTTTTARRIRRTVAAGAGSSPAPEPSQNRFGDFENGVLFWRRGATAAQQLRPWTQSAGGGDMGRTAAEVVEAMRPALRRALGDLSGASLSGFAFAGTDPYSWDGVSVRNRRHRVLAKLTLSHELSGPFGIGVSIPTLPLTVELQLEVVFEPIERLVAVFLAEWQMAAMSPLDVPPRLERQLHERLDRMLFEKATLIELPDTEGDRPIAVLSVKTMPDGDVVIYIEPSGLPFPVHDFDLERPLHIDAGRLPGGPVIDR